MIETPGTVSGCCDERGERGRRVYTVRLKMRVILYEQLSAEEYGEDIAHAVDHPSQEITQRAMYQPAARR